VKRDVVEEVLEVADYLLIPTWNEGDMIGFMRQSKG